MLVMILERVSPSLRGELTRWLIQPKTGVFVGRVSARVRDHLWERVVKALKGGAAIMVTTAATEQGYAIRSAGRTSKLVRDFEGLQLPVTPKTA